MAIIHLVNHILLICALSVLECAQAGKPWASLRNYEAIRKSGQDIAAKGIDFISLTEAKHFLVFTETGSGMSIESPWYTCKSEFRTPFTAIVGYTVSNTVFWDDVIPVPTTLTYSLGSTIASPFFFSTSMTYKNTTILSSGTAFADPLYVYWQLKDLSVFPPDYASSLATQISVPFSLTPAPSPSLSSTIPPPTSSAVKEVSAPDLSPAIKAGIGVGSVIGGLALGAIFVTILWWRRRKRVAKIHPSEPELSGHSRGLMIFSKGKWRAEADGSSQPVEAGGRSVVVVPGSPVELEAPH